MKYTVSLKLEKNSNYNGTIVLNSLAEALEIAKPFDEIYLIDNAYYGKFYVKTPNLRIIGNSSYPKITYDAYHSRIKRIEDGGDGVKVYGTTGSSTLTILPQAHDLYMEYVCVENSHKRVLNVKNQQNVAFKTEACDGRFFRVKFISTQDTLYIEGNNNSFKECYIEGDVDFIFGPADALIYDSEIKMLKVLDSDAYLCAPNTYVFNKYGLVFYNNRVIGMDGNDKYLGRAWYPKGAIYELEPRAMFMATDFEARMNLELITMHNGDPINYHYYLSNCKYIGEKISNSTADVDSFYLEYIKKYQF